MKRYTPLFVILLLLFSNLSLFVISDKEVEKLKDLGNPYIFVPPTTVGTFGKHVVNVPYFRDWLNKTITWNVQKSVDNITWTDYSKFEVKKEWNEKETKEKYTIIINSDEDAYYRILTSTNSEKELIAYKDVSKEELLNKSDKFLMKFKDYDIEYNWSDYSSSTASLNSKYESLISTDKNNKKSFNWMVTTVVKVLKNKQFILDPSYGVIANTVVSSWQFTTDDVDSISMESTSAMIRLGVSEYYVLATGYHPSATPAQRYLYLYTFKIWNINGTIVKSFIDSWNTTFSSATTASINQISGNIYSISYYNGTNKYAVFTTQIWSDNGTMTKTFIDFFDYTNGNPFELLHVTGNIYASITSNGTTSTIETIQINLSGTINDTHLDVVEFTTNSSIPYNIGSCSIDSDTIAIYYGDEQNQNITTYNISSSGDITNTPSDNWTVNTSYTFIKRIYHIANDIYAITSVEYVDGIPVTNLTTVRIYDNGTFQKSFLDHHMFNDIANVKASSDLVPVAPASVHGTGVYLFIFLCAATQGYAETINISDTGDIGNTIIDSLQFSTDFEDDIISCTIHASGDYYLIGYEGNNKYSGNLVTISVKTPVTTPPTISLIYAGNQSKECSTEDNMVRYVNQSYNNETFCNVTANITVPLARYMGQYYKTLYDDILVPSGNLTDNDTGYVHEGNHSLIATKYTCGYTANYSQISAYIIGSGMSPPWVSYAIYTDNAGEPGTLLGFTERDWPGNSTFSDLERDLGTLYYPPCTRLWYTLNISYDGAGSTATNISLTEGTNYWLVMATNDSFGYTTYGYTYSNDIYWLLGNNLGVDIEVMTAPYNIESDMNFSNVSSPVWANHSTAHHCCIYAIANNTYNPAIQVVNISSALLMWYENGVNIQNYEMSQIGSTGNWSYNVTGLLPDIWYSFTISAIDDAFDRIEYAHFRSIIEGKTERIEFQCNAPTEDTATHQGYNSTSTLYRNESVLYLWNYTYGTDEWYGDDEHMENALPHEQGVDGTSNDTGSWKSNFPTDEMQARYCLKFAGGWWDDNITIEDTINLTNIHIHWWTGGGVKWNTTRIHYGRMTTLYNFGWLLLTSTIGVDLNYLELQQNTSTKTAKVVPVPKTVSDPSGTDNYMRLFCENINLTENLTNTVFDTGSIYNFFIGYDNNGSLAWTKQSAMIISNRSYPSYIIFNIPNDILDGTDNTTDSDGDTLPDHYELNSTFTSPFITDTDNDGYNDSEEVTIYHTNPNDYEDLNEPPVSSAWTISNGTTNVAINVSYWNVTITDPNGDALNVTMFCNNSNNRTYNLTASGTVFSLNLTNPLSNDTNYTVYLNITDSFNYVNETYWFITKSNKTVDHVCIVYEIDLFKADEVATTVFNIIGVILIIGAILLILHVKKKIDET
jgi:hypothetical protein